MKRTYGELRKKWDSLLRACRDNPDLVAMFERELSAFEEILRKGHEARGRCDILRGEKLQATRELREAMQRAEALSSQLRHGVKGRLGVRSPLLLRYGIKPLKPRKPRLRA